jgi:hypothetical protein
MPTGRYGCERDLAAQVTKFDQAYAFVSVTYQSRLWLDARACSWRVVTLRVSLPAPLGQRSVYFNGDTIFLASHGKLILQCTALNGVGCGIPAPLVPASCTSRSYQQAMGETAPPVDGAPGRPAVPRTAVRRSPGPPRVRMTPAR